MRERYERETDSRKRDSQKETEGGERQTKDRRNGLLLYVTNDACPNACPNACGDIIWPFRYDLLKKGFQDRGGKSRKILLIHEFNFLWIHQNDI